MFSRVLIPGASLVAQWLGFRASIAGLIPGQGTKILLATLSSHKKEAAVSIDTQASPLEILIQFCLGRTPCIDIF